VIPPEPAAVTPSLPCAASCRAVAQTDADALILRGHGSQQRFAAHAFAPGQCARKRPVVHINCAALPPIALSSLSYLATRQAPIRCGPLARYGKLSTGGGGTNISGRGSNSRPALCKQVAGTRSRTATIHAAGVQRSEFPLDVRFHR